MAGMQCRLAALQSLRCRLREDDACSQPVFQRATQHVPSLDALQATPCNKCFNSMRALRGAPQAHALTHCGSRCVQWNCRSEQRPLAQPVGTDHR